MERADILAGLREDPPTLIGLGAIGSWVARWLMANGIPFTGYDDDRVSLKNLSAAAFTTADVGQYKGKVLNASVSRWEGNPGTYPILMCADHGPTRRKAAYCAMNRVKDFTCAKANGNLWQVWHVPAGSPCDDFIAFDEAAERDPVPTPCGDPTVGRVASLGAAAELLSTWTGLAITADEVEASYGVAYDPAIVHHMASHWAKSRPDAEIAATAAAEQAYRESIEKSRIDSDQLAVQDLEQIREERWDRQRKRYSTIHERARVSLDSGRATRPAARIAASLTSSKIGLQALRNAESRVLAHRMQTAFSVPETVTIEEAIA